MYNEEKLPPNYKLIKYISKGSYGKVYLVKNTEYDNYTTLKKYDILKNDIGGDIIKECVIYNTLQHKNIVTSKKFFNYDNCFYSEMEYLNKNINDYYNYELKTIKRMIRDVLSGIEHLHNHGIVHSDIKPANILTDKNNTIFKLCDFGLSEYIGYPYLNKKLICTAGFMAPECFSFEKKKNRY